MKVWTFTNESARSDQHGLYVVIAETEKDAVKLVKKALNDAYRQNVRDFEIVEIDLATAPAGIIADEFHAG
jgi:hypothetical protein